MVDCESAGLGSNPGARTKIYIKNVIVFPDVSKWLACKTQEELEKVYYKNLGLNPRMYYRISVNELNSIINGCQ